MYKWDKYSNVFLILLIVATIAIGIVGIGNEGFAWNDAQAHAFDGIFYMDFIKEMPILNIYDWTMQYYAHNPVLMVSIWPPVHPFVEGIFFLIFGVSEFSARLSVLFFSIIAIIFFYKLVKERFGTKAALFAGALFTTNFYLTYWSHMVMIEMPTMAMILISLYVMYKVVEKNKKYDWLIPPTIAISLLTKESAVFLVPFFIAYVIIFKKWKHFINLKFILSTVISIAIMLPWYLVTFSVGRHPEIVALLLNMKVWLIGLVFIIILSYFIKFQKKLIKKHNKAILQATVIFTLAALAYLIKWNALLGILKWGYLQHFHVLTYIVGVVGFFYFIITKKFKKYALEYLWIATFILTTNILIGGWNEPRFTYFYIPALLIIVVEILEVIKYKIGKVKISTIILIVLVLLQIMVLFNYESKLNLIQNLNNSLVYDKNLGYDITLVNKYFSNEPRYDAAETRLDHTVSGFKEAATLTMEEEGNIMYMGGNGHAQFAFQLRKFDTDRDKIIWRAEHHYMNTDRIFTMSFNIIDKNISENELYNDLDHYKTRYVVLKNEEKHIQKTPNYYKIIPQMLETENFTLIKEIKIESDHHLWKDNWIKVYKYNKNFTNYEVDVVKLPELGREVRLK